MRHVLGILILLVLFLLARKLYDHYQTIRLQSESPREAESPKFPGQELPGLPPSLEPSLSAARQQGAAALQTWLTNYRAYVTDPRLAEIELDYVVLLSQQDPVEAKRVFQAVKARVPTSSPVYPRLRKLAPTYD